MFCRDRWPRVCLAPASPRLASSAGPGVRVITASGPRLAVEQYFRPRVSAIPSQVQPGVDGGRGGSGRYQVAGSGLLLLTARTTIRPPIGVARQKMTSQNISNRRKIFLRRWVVEEKDVFDS